MAADQVTKMTLGCNCDRPKPAHEGSALCAKCGLIHLTSEEYSEHLAREREKAAALIAGQPTVAQPQQDARRGLRSAFWAKLRGRPEGSTQPVSAPSTA